MLKNYSCDEVSIIHSGTAFLPPSFLPLSMFIPVQENPRFLPTRFPGGSAHPPSSSLSSLCLSS